MAKLAYLDDEISDESWEENDLFNITDPLIFRQIRSFFSWIYFVINKSIHLGKKVLTISK